ncbi:MAG: O-antigen ligase family protein [Pirellula sp.]|nr:O-antigen ligase family protein [Pirellula sp.]
MKDKEEGIAKSNSWIISLPLYVLYLLVGGYLVAAQWSPSDSTSVASGDSLVLIIIGLAIGFLSSIVLLLRGRDDSTRRLPVFITILFIGWLALATFASYGHGNFRISLLGFWQTVALVGVLQGFVILFISKSIQNKVLHWSIALSCGTSAYALYQYFVSMPQTRARFALFKEEMLQDVGIVAGTPEAMQFENRLYSTEPFGPFALTNSLAGTLAPIFVLVGIVLVGALWKGRGRHLACGGFSTEECRDSSDRANPNWRRIALWSVILALTGSVLLLTKSRTAWLAAIVGFAVGGIILAQISSRLKMRSVAIVVISTISLGLFATMVLAWVDSAIIWEAGKSFLYRMEYWQGAWQLALRSPLVGYGPLAFQSEYTTVKSMVASENPADPHNMWMEILVCGGFPLLGLSIAGAIWLIASNVSRFLKIMALENQPSMGSPGADKNQEMPGVDSLAINKEREILFDAGALVVLGLILFFGLIVYSVNPKTDLWLTSLTFCLGATVCFWFVRSWRFSEVGRWLASVLIVLVVAIHFLFSGGWMQPGTMSLLLVALAGLFRSGERYGLTDVPATAGVRSWQSFALFVGWGGAAASFGGLTFQPEMGKGPIAQLQLENRVVEIPPNEYSAILDLGGWDPEPASWLQREAFQRLTDRNLGQTSRIKWLEVYKLARGKWLINDSRNWLVANQVSIMDAAVIEACKSSGLDPIGFLELNDVIAQANRATQLNPSSAPCHLQMAVFLYWAKDVDASKASLEIAEKIDETTPHADRKIAVSSIWVPLDVVREGAQSLQASQAAGMPGFFKGEPVFSWLRKVIP